MSLPDHNGLALAFLLVWAAKATALLVAAWIATLALRRRSAAWRHQLWAIAILGSLALPVLSAALPRWQPATEGRATITQARNNSYMVASTALQAEAAASWSDRVFSRFINSLSRIGVVHFMLALWALGSVLCLLKLLVGITRMAWLGGKSKPLLDDGWAQTVGELCRTFGIERRVRLVECATTTAMPATWGALPPRILLPASSSDWTEERRRIVLAHELAHICRHDWLVQMSAELLRSLLWFNPLVWLAASQLRQESECACDDSVLNSGVKPDVYASELLILARTLRRHQEEFAVALAVARSSNNLERRFAAMLNRSIDRSPLSKRSRVLAIFLGACLLVPFGMRARAQGLSGNFTGTACDPTGAIVQNALVTMTNARADTTDTTRSDAAGNFGFATLPAGEYELRIEAPDFQSYTQPVTIENGRNVYVSATLTIGLIEQKVTVQASLPVVAERPGTQNLRVGGHVTSARLLNQVPPVYPASAKAAGIEGNVILHAVIGKDGRLASLRVVNTQVDPDLAQAAMDAVSQWEYSPALVDGQPIETQTALTINFAASPVQ